MTVFNFYVLILHLCATIKVILLLLFIFIVILPVIIRSWGQDPAAEDGMQRAGFPGRAPSPSRASQPVGLSARRSLKPACGS